MTTTAGPGSQRRWRHDDPRSLVPVVAAAVAALAALVDPGGARAALLVIPVGAFAVWLLTPRLTAPALGSAVIAPVVAAQLRGALEPSLFEVALLGFAVTGWDDASGRVGVAVACAAAVLSPVLMWALQPSSNHVAWPLWVIGIAFAALGGRSMRQRQRLERTLAEARAQMERHAQEQERRRIARDVHDLVGHGLATVLMQVSSARHVLERDPAAAAEALESAQETGRRSMRDLRGTVALLRDGEPDGGPRDGVPELGQIQALVASARSDGLDVELELDGDPTDVAPSTGLALYRITQEALHNATKHAPAAKTAVRLSIEPREAALAIDSRGPLAAVSEPGRARFGVIGMRERASAVGGELHAGPSDDGWRVTCRVPVGAA